jgi:prepilin-type processing-associated H-X9-DG protein
VDGNSEAGLVVLAERTPAYAGLKPDFDWAKPGKDDSNTGMSQNHTRGQMINLLFADLHVGESLKRADCGINYDNVYSAAGAGENGKPLDVNQGPGSMKLADHKSPQDSFLIGPVKMEKAAREK